MFKRWNDKLKRLAGRVGTFMAARAEKWQAECRASAEREYLSIGFQELTPLEEAKIRTGYWNPRW